MPVTSDEIGEGDKASGRISKNQLALVGVLRPYRVPVAELILAPFG